MAEKSCGFAIGNLRARENGLLRAADLHQLCAAPDLTALASALRDKGFGNRANSTSVEALLAEDSRQMWDYLEEIAPDAQLFAPFLTVHDFHNIKAVLKAVVRGVDAAPFLLHPATADPEVLQTAVREKKWELLPGEMAAAAERAYGILVSSGDGQLCDAVVDAAGMRARLSAVRRKGIAPLVREIVETAVFFENVKAALRCAKTKKSAAFIEETLVDTAPVSKSALKTAVLAGEDAVLELLRHTGKVGIAAADAYESAPAEFERFCEDAVMEIARKAKQITLGVEPMIGYYMARTTEQKNVRIIASAVAVGQPEEITRGRLRALYG